MTMTRQSVMSQRSLLLLVIVAGAMLVANVAAQSTTPRVRIMGNLLDSCPKNWTFTANVEPCMFSAGKDADTPSRREPRCRPNKLAKQNSRRRGRRLNLWRGGAGRGEEGGAGGGGGG